ncbi:MAG: hypothetical protein WCG80_15310 [Spirochaetales bacterium]
MRIPNLLVVTLVALFLVSCATTRNNAFVQADSAVAARQYQAAAKSLEAKGNQSNYSDRDQVLKQLDTAMLYHLDDQAAASTSRFDAAERLIEDNYTKSLTNAAASFVVNDYLLDYPGEAYEDLYLNVFKALDYLGLGQGDDAFVEINRLNDKLNLLEDKYARLAASMNSAPEARGSVQPGKTEFHNSALARYLSLALYRAEGSTDNAAIDLDKLRQAFATQRNLYAFAPPRLDVTPAPDGSVRLSVVGFTGRSPAKRASTLRIRTGENTISVTSEVEDSRGRLQQTGSFTLRVSGVRSGYNFKAQLPEMYLRPSMVARIGVSVDGKAVGSLQLLERMDAIALDTFNLGKQSTLIKTVLRTVSKGILAGAANNKARELAANSGNSALNLLAQVGTLAADAAVDASEQADLRSARYFPGQAWVGDFVIPEGPHSVTVDYHSADGRLLYLEALPRRNYSASEPNIVDSFDLE